jgi:hypothetical protein
MKGLLSTATVALAGLCVVGSLQAQTREVRANIPFNFIVGSQQLPAGSYEFSPGNDYTLVIQNREHPATLLSMFKKQDTSAGAKCQLVFDKYGDRYFLREVQSNAVAINGSVPVSKLEKQAGRHEASIQTETVLVALGD